MADGFNPYPDGAAHIVADTPNSSISFSPEKGARVMLPVRVEGLPRTVIGTGRSVEDAAQEALELRATQERVYAS